MRLGQRGGGDGRAEVIAQIDPALFQGIMLQAKADYANAKANLAVRDGTEVVYTEWIFFAIMAAGLMRLRRRPTPRQPRATPCRR